jgi:transcription elongation factor Elf1
MGRRKTKAKKVAKKKRPGVPTQFKCLFCNHEDAVSVTLDTKTMVGDLKCDMCGANFQTSIHGLTDPVDVFSEWFDSTEEAQEAENARG